MHRFGLDWNIATGGEERAYLANYASGRYDIYEQAHVYQTSNQGESHITGGGILNFERDANGGLSSSGAWNFDKDTEGLAVAGGAGFTMRRQFGMASPVSVAASGSHLALGTDANGNPLVAPDGQAPLNDALRHVAFSQSMGDAFDMEDLLSLSYTVETGEAGEGEDPPPPRFVAQRDHQWRNATAGNYRVLPASVQKVFCRVD